MPPKVPAQPQTTTRKLLQILLRSSQFMVPLLIVVLLWRHVAPLLLLMVLALLLASILAPPTSWLEFQLADSRLLAVLVIYGTIILVIVTLVSFLAPILVSEANSMASALGGQSIQTLTATLETALMDILPRDIAAMMEANMGAWVANSGTFLQSLLDDLAGIIGALVGLVMNVLLVLVFTFILLLDSRNFKVRFIRTVPNAYFEMTLNLLDKIQGQVSGYLRGQGIAAVTVGVLCTIGLYFLSWLLDVSIPYAFIIGMLAGFANLIPVVGPFLGMAPAIMAYLMTPQTAGIQAMVIFAIVLMFLVVQMIDNFFVSPKIMSASVGMHPLVIIVVIMIGNSLMGPVGMLFAVPTFGVIRVTLAELVWGLRAYRII